MSACVPSGSSREWDEPDENAATGASDLLLPHSDERRDDERRPLWAEPPLRAVLVPLVQRVRPIASSAAVDRDARQAEADGSVRVRARRARTNGEAECTGRALRRAHDRG